MTSIDYECYKMNGGKRKFHLSVSTPDYLIQMSTTDQVFISVHMAGIEALERNNSSLDECLLTTFARMYQRYLFDDKLGKFTYCCIPQEKEEEEMFFSDVYTPDELNEVLESGKTALHQLTAGRLTYQIKLVTGDVYYTQRDPLPTVYTDEFIQAVRSLDDCRYLNEDEFKAVCVYVRHDYIVSIERM